MLCHEETGQDQRVEVPERDGQPDIVPDSIVRDISTRQRLCVVAADLEDVWGWAIAGEWALIGDMVFEALVFRVVVVDPE